MMIKIAIAGAALAAFSLWLGLLDRPEFSHRSKLLPDGTDLYAILSISDSPDVEYHMPRLLANAMRAIESTPGGRNLMERAARAYGAPMGSERLSVRLYFDNPYSDLPRWAAGYAVRTADYDSARELASAASAGTTAPEPLRAVRIDGPAVGGRVPYRHFLTPLVAPVLHWGRAFDVYTRGGYRSGGRTEREGQIACEIYVTGADGWPISIDYVMLIGDVRNTWGDALPRGR